MKAHNSKLGFTLIELLVVIAIIAVLAAILFPVFAAAREKAKTATCVSNLKQIGIALIQYCDDYDGYGPFITWHSDDPDYPGSNGLHKLGPYSCPVRNRFTGAINPVFVCNGKGKPTTYGLPWAGGGSWYGQAPPWGADKTNVYADEGLTPANAMMVADICIPPELMISPDSCDFYGYASYFYEPKGPEKNAAPEMLAKYASHGNRNNMCFRDGHAKGLTQGEMMVGANWWGAIEGIQ